MHEKAPNLYCHFKIVIINPFSLFWFSIPGSPLPRRRLRSPEQTSISSQQSRGYNSAPHSHHEMSAVNKVQRFEDEYSISDQGYYDDGSRGRSHSQQNWAQEKHRYNERSSAELTPDSGISTTSDSIDRVRRPQPPESSLRRGLGKRQLTRQEGVEDTVYAQHQHPNHHDPHYQQQQQQQQHHQPHPGHHHNHHQPHQQDDRYSNEYRQDSVEEEEDSTSFDVRYEDDDTDSLRRQKKARRKKLMEVPPSKLDLPPGHVRTFEGSFPSRCRIKYLPKSTSRDEDWKDPDLDTEGTLAVQSGRMVRVVRY